MYPRKLYRPWPLWLCWIAGTYSITANILILAYYILDAYGADPKSVSGIAYFFLALHILTLVAAPTEVVLWSHHLMDPWVYFTLQAAKALYFTIFSPIALRNLFMMDVYIAIEAAVATHLILIIFAFWASFGYSLFILFKMRKMGGRYGQLSVYQQEDERATRHDRKDMKEQIYGDAR